MIFLLFSGNDTVPPTAPVWQNPPESGEMYGLDSIDKPGSNPPEYSMTAEPQEYSVNPGSQEELTPADGQQTTSGL